MTGVRDQLGQVPDVGIADLDDEARLRAALRIRDHARDRDERVMFGRMCGLLPDPPRAGRGRGRDAGGKFTPGGAP